MKKATKENQIHKCCSLTSASVATCLSLVMNMNGQKNFSSLFSQSLGVQSPSSKDNSGKRKYKELKRRHKPVSGRVPIVLVPEYPNLLLLLTSVNQAFFNQIKIAIMVWWCVFCATELNGSTTPTRWFVEIPSTSFYVTPKSTKDLPV